MSVVVAWVADRKWGFTMVSRCQKLSFIREKWYWESVLVKVDD